MLAQKLLNQGKKGTEPQDVEQIYKIIELVCSDQFSENWPDQAGVELQIQKIIEYAGSIFGGNA